jgi:hypothetical protein
VAQAPQNSSVFLNLQKVYAFGIYPVLKAIRRLASVQIGSPFSKDYKSL